MMILTFDAEIQKHPGMNAAFIEFPYDVEKEFGKKGQVKVIATFDGVKYRGSLVKMERDCHWIGLTQEIRKQIGKSHGDMVHVTIQEDTEPRIVEVPNDLKIQLDHHPQALDLFQKLSYTHKKEYVRWITEAKREETRNSRLEKTIDLLMKGIKTPDNQK